MLFNSWQFVLFLPMVVALHFALPHRARWALLLLASYVFYACWEPAYLLLIVASTLVDYLAGLGMQSAREVGRRRLLLGASLTCNLGLLFSFKYWDFFAGSIHEGLGWAGLGWELPVLDVLLPVGISFYTFQTLSYTIEVYRGNQRAERHLGVFALYVSYFPQLVAGPIERSVNLLPQLRDPVRFDAERSADGLRLIVCGLVKKVVIADRLALVVDTIYADPAAREGPLLVVGTLFFAFQIYCDFSGYSDIAIGSAELLGHRLMKNFERPYFATSISDFWSRWHISLSSWFRDYVYIPLGGSRVSQVTVWRNVVAVFLLSGLWHGAAWTFVVWGALHGAYYLCGQLTAGVRRRLAELTGLERLPRVSAAMAGLWTFVTVCFAWIFFRADSLTDALDVVGGMTSGWSILGAGGFADALEAAGGEPREARTGALLILALLTCQVLRGERRSSEWVGAGGPVRRWALATALVLLALNLGVAEVVPFLYFQF